MNLVNLNRGDGGLMEAEIWASTTELRPDEAFVDLMVVLIRD